MNSIVFNALNGVVFVAGFLFAATYRFQRYVFDQVHSTGVFLVLSLAAVVSGISLVFFLARLSLFPKVLWQKLLGGALLGLVAFFLIFEIEDGLSAKRFHQQSQPSDFSELRGHCGVYVGRPMLRWVGEFTKSSLDSGLQDLAMSNRCRLTHLRKLEQLHAMACELQKDEVQCVIKWMNGFAAKGYWSAPLRRYFFTKIAEIYQENKAPGSAKLNPQAPLIGSYAEYALRDHELEVSRPNYFQQAGVTEQFSDQFAIMKTKEELENVVVSNDIMNFVSRVVKVPENDDSPLLTRFHELVQETRLQAEKIPDLEKDLNGIARRMNDKETP